MDVTKDQMTGGGIELENKQVIITVYGAQQICASCVGAPGSKDTYEWLQAAIGRKYDVEAIKYEYIDIDEPQELAKHKKFVARVFEEDLFFPVVLVDDVIVGEGIPRLKKIYQALDERGVALQS